jgi:hypothetical protein
MRTDAPKNYVTMLRAGRSQVRVPAEERNASLLPDIQTGTEAQSASYLMDAGGVLSAGIKRTGRKVNKSSSSHADFKNDWHRTATLPHALMA